MVTTRPAAIRHSSERVRVPFGMGQNTRCSARSAGQAARRGAARKPRLCACARAGRTPGGTCAGAKGANANRFVFTFIDDAYARKSTPPLRTAPAPPCLADSPSVSFADQTAPRQSAGPSDETPLRGATMGQPRHRPRVVSSQFNRKRRSASTSKQACFSNNLYIIHSRKAFLFKFFSNNVEFTCNVEHAIGSERHAVVMPERFPSACTSQFVSSVLRRRRLA